MNPEEIDALADVIALRVAKLNQPPGLVDAPRIAKQLGVPATWVRSEARAGRIPHVRLGRYVRFDPTRIAEWWAQQANAA